MIPASDVAPLGRALERVRLRTGASLAFAGMVGASGDVTLEHFSGPVNGALPGVVLKNGEGLGGRSVALRRPIGVNDYFSSQQISHHYDRIIRAEGLRSLAAAPVIVGRDPVGILYATFRNDTPVGGRVLDGLISEARAVEQELLVSATLRARENDAALADVTRLRGRLRAAHAELRVLGARVEDKQIAAALRVVADLLAESGRCDPDVVLTARESDVLALVSTGLTNQVIAIRLGLTLNTVKSYIRSAMAKLGATTRWEAVVNARSMGLLP